MFKSAQVNYEVVGNGSNNLVFLHGWGGNVDSFKFICNHLSVSHKALFIDFPPFGKSTEMQYPWTFFDYVELVAEIMQKENMQKSTIIGHSFGGRVALVLANKGFAEKLILVDSAGLKPKRTIKYHLKVCFNKIKQKFGCSNIKGSTDYNNLSPIMKKTFVNIVNTFLEKYAINITKPTVLFWGEKDNQTPMYMAKRLNKLIKNSELVVIKNAGHFSYLDDFNTFLRVVEHVIKQ